MYSLKNFNQAIVPNGDEFLFVVSPDKQKRKFSAYSAVVRKNSKTIKIAKSAAMKSNTYNCSFWRKGIFSHDLRLCGE